MEKHADVLHALVGKRLASITEPKLLHSDDIFRIQLVRRRCKGSATVDHGQPLWTRLGKAMEIGLRTSVRADGKQPHKAQVAFQVRYLADRQQFRNAKTILLKGTQKLS